MSSILPLHEGRRLLISEEYIDSGTSDESLKILIAVLRSITKEDQSVIHIQKVLAREGKEIVNRKGGFIVPASVIPELKSAIDKAYMVCCENGLFDE